MFGRRKAAIGLDVGTHAIKAVEVSVSGSSVAITNAGYQEVPNPDARGEALKQLVLDKGLRGTDVVTSVAGRSVIVRYVNLRKMDSSELHNAIRFEADKYIPFSMIDGDVVHLEAFSFTVTKSLDSESSFGTYDQYHLGVGRNFISFFFPLECRDLEVFHHAKNRLYIHTDEDLVITSKDSRQPPFVLNPSLLKRISLNRLVLSDPQYELVKKICE